MNAVAERWVGTARPECLDHILVFGQGHLDQSPREFIDHYYTRRSTSALTGIRWSLNVGLAMRPEQDADCQAVCQSDRPIDMAQRLAPPHHLRDRIGPVQVFALEGDPAQQCEVAARPLGSG